MRTERFLEWLADRGERDPFPTKQMPRHIGHVGVKELACQPVGHTGFEFDGVAIEEWLACGGAGQPLKPM